MGLRDQLRRLRKEARGEMDSFVLEDSTRYYFDATSWDIFLHYSECIGTSAHNWPPPPEVLQKVCEAKDPERALEQVMGGQHFLVYDPEVIVNERRFVPRGLVSRYDDPDTGEHVVLDPYDSPVEDLSE